MIETQTQENNLLLFDHLKSKFNNQRKKDNLFCKIVYFEKNIKKQYKTFFQKMFIFKNNIKTI